MKKAKQMGWGVVLLSLVGAVAVYPAAARPTFLSEKPAKQAPVLDQPLPIQTLVSESAQVAPTTPPATLDDQRMKISTHLKQKQFEKAREVYQTIDNQWLSDRERKDKEQLAYFYQVTQERLENERQFGKDESLSLGTRRAVTRLQREGKRFILEEKSALARDMLIQSLYLDRKNVESKLLLERVLDMPVGTYRVENIEKKYWDDSLTQLRVGYPQNAIEALQVLSYFDPKNPIIFERMGSAYYLAGNIDKAIQSWKRALYLNPNNPDLKGFIANAEEAYERQKKESQAFFAQKKKEQEADTPALTGPLQTLRVVNDATEAYSYAQEVRKQLKGTPVQVDELENGKWAVRIPLKKATKETQ